MIQYSRGANIRDVHPEQRAVPDFGAFVDALNSDRAAEKSAAAYVCGPLNGTGHRCAEGTLPRRFAALDFDQIAAPRLPELREWLRQFSAAAWFTHSSTEAAPRMRAIVELDREITRDEGIVLGRVLAQDVLGRFGGEVALDESTFKAEQAAFVPPTTARLSRAQGNPLDVSGHLARYVPPKAAPKLPQVGPDAHGAQIDDLRDALRVLDANDRETWIANGQRLKSLGDTGYGLWIEWSARSPKFDADDAARVWRGLDGSHTAPAAVFTAAQAAGWVNPGRRAAVPDGPAPELLVPPDFSDDALALDFVRAYGRGYRWSPGLGWMAAGATVWTRDDALTRYDLARRICRAAAACAQKPDEQKRLTSAKTVGAVLSLAQSDQRIVVDAGLWDAQPLLLNTPAGIVDLRTGLLRHRRGDDYVTQATRIAPDFGVKASVFDKFIHEVFDGDSELVNFMQVVLGYCLTGDRREQFLFFWHGVGANGKSTLLDLVQHMLDTYALKMPAAALMVTRNDRHPTELAQLRGKRLAISSELEEGQFWNEALIKELTGDAVLTARFMRQDFFEFNMTQKHIIVGNHKPRLRGGDPAIARRLVLVPFLQKFEGAKRDNQLGEKLQAEAPAVLAWMVRGAVRWHAEGLVVPEKVRDAGAEYLADHDDLALWLGECCIRTGEAKASELYSSFKLWKERRGEHAQSQTAWSQRLQMAPGVVRRVSNGVRYAGIQLNAEEERSVRYAA